MVVPLPLLLQTTALPFSNETVVAFFRSDEDSDDFGFSASVGVTLS
jgi:hypothetical protein